MRSHKQLLLDAVRCFLLFICLKELTVPTWIPLIPYAIHLLGCITRHYDLFLTQTDDWTEGWLFTSASLKLECACCSRIMRERNPIGPLLTCKSFVTYPKANRFHSISTQVPFGCCVFKRLTRSYVKCVQHDRETKHWFPILLIFRLDLKRDLIAFWDCLSLGLCSWSIIIKIKEGSHFSGAVSNLTESV